MKIGFIGLGIMGKPMAKNLLKAGHTLVVYNRSVAAVKELVAAGAESAVSISEVAKKSDMVITMLPNSPDVKAVVLGKEGVLSGAKAGQIIVDMSSISPIVSQEIFEACKAKGVSLLDAPVSGGEPKAIDGTLSIMVGGEKDAFDKVYDILMTLGASAVYCGESGAGNTTKLANQVIVALNIAAVSEAFVLAKKAGVDPETVFQAIRGGLAGSTVMETKAPMMLERNFNPGFKIDLHIKDLGNVMDTAKALDMPMVLSSQVMEMMQNLSNRGEGQSDHAALLKFYEALVGIEL